MRRLALLFLFGCNGPDIDPHDLAGVFDHPSASATALSAAAPARSAKAEAEPDDDRPRPPALVRSADKGPCVAAAGQPLAADDRPARRPACRRSRVLEQRDREGKPRYSCVFAPGDLEARAPLPLVVFLHDELDDPTSVHDKTHLRRLLDDIDLTGDPRRRGFVLLAPQARRIQHRTRFDSSYHAAENIDAEVIDRFVDELVADGGIDQRRIYAIGAGRGGEMAALWTMLRPGRVAAWGSYAAAPALRWSCRGEPPPAAILYRGCDAVTACADVEQQLLARERERAPTMALRLGAGNATEPSCATSRHRCSDKRGAGNHARWPKQRERELLEYLGRFSLAR